MTNAQKSSARIIIIGAGFAGAATAWWLRQMGETDVVILERETAPGAQASGQNAAMARQATADLPVSKLLAEGVRFMTRPPDAFRAARPVIRRTGSALVGTESHLKKFADVMGRVLPRDEFELTGTGRLSSVSYLAGIRPQTALITHSDGFIDLKSLLDGFLEGMDVRVSCAVRLAGRRPNGWAIQTDHGPFECGTLVIAAGAWSNLCATSVGANVLPIRPTRRHLFQTVARKDFEQDAPFVWDVTTECYVRPDCDGHLFSSACDQEPHDPAAPLRPDPRQILTLNEKIARTFPALKEILWRRYWPGTRALTPDGRFVIGADPAAERLFWVAGLGGHGVTTAPAVGRIAAEAILGIRPTPVELTPARFVSNQR